jgi:hypothetical protein
LIAAQTGNLVVMVVLVVVVVLLLLILMVLVVVVVVMVLIVVVVFSCNQRGYDFVLPCTPQQMQSQQQNQTHHGNKPKVKTPSFTPAPLQRSRQHAHHPQQLARQQQHTAYASHPYNSHSFAVLNHRIQ